MGEFGAAYRLIEATMFVPAAFNAAALAWFSREAEIGRGFEMAIKTVLALMLPIGLGLALFAEPLIEALYGADYGGAVTPLRILGAVAALWGVNTTIVTVLVSRARPDVYTFPALVALVPNAVLALVLIPGHGADGAAIAALAGAAVLVALALPRTARLVGAGGFVRVLAAPLGGGCGDGACAAALSGLPWIPAAIGSVATYAAAFLVIERVFSRVTSRSTSARCPGPDPEPVEPRLDLPLERDLGAGAVDAAGRARACARREVGGAAVLVQAGEQVGVGVAASPRSARGDGVGRAG